MYSYWGYAAIPVLGTEGKNNGTSASRVGGDMPCFVSNVFMASIRGLLLKASLWKAFILTLWPIFIQTIPIRKYTAHEMPILKAYLRILVKKERRMATGIIAKENIKGKIKSIESHKIASDPFGETAHHCAATKKPFKIKTIGADKRRVRFIRLSASGYICFLSSNLFLILCLSHIIDKKEGLSTNFCC